MPTWFLQRTTIDLYFIEIEAVYNCLLVTVIIHRDERGINPQVHFSASSLFIQRVIELITDATKA